MKNIAAFALAAVATLAAACTNQDASSAESAAAPAAKKKVFQLVSCPSTHPDLGGRVAFALDLVATAQKKPVGFEWKGTKNSPALNPDSAPKVGK